MKSLLIKSRNAVLSIIVLNLIFFIGWTISTSAAPTVTSKTDKLNVHFIDVGYGDSILLDLGETEILIDGGLPKPGIVAYIKDYVNGPLEAMVATHPHGDHVGGLIEVLETFDVNEIWLNGDKVPNSFPIPAFIKIYEKFMSSVKAEGATIHEARRGQKIDIGILSLHVLHPDVLLPSIENTKNTNTNSMVLRLRYGNVAFLFAGDASKQSEASILKAGLSVRADILKVGHHGSINSCSPQFLNAVSPKVAVYMSGEKRKDVKIKTPDEKTIAALREAGADVYGTKPNGTIIITTDGKTYTIDTEK